MASQFSKILCFILAVSAITCSGEELVRFSFDVRKSEGDTATSFKRAITWPREAGVSPSLIKVSAVDHDAISSLANFGSIPVHLYLTSPTATTSTTAPPWFYSALVDVASHLLPHVNVTGIVLTPPYHQPKTHPLSLAAGLMRDLQSIHSALKMLGLDRHIKVSVAFPLAVLEDKSTTEEALKLLRRIAGFVRRWESSIYVETEFDGDQLSLGDAFVGLAKEKAASVVAAFDFPDGSEYDHIPLVLNIRSAAFPAPAEAALFLKKMKHGIEGDVRIASRIRALQVDLTPLALGYYNFEQKQVDYWERQQIFPTSHHRRLIRTSRHDEIIMPFPPTTVIPTTNPVSTPIPATPTTNPVTILPTNPVTGPLPNPFTAPIGVPDTNPVVTTPVVGGAYPTSPAAGTTTFPLPPPATSIPITTPVVPVTMLPPPAMPYSPAVGGAGSWCVAKMGAMETAVQMALDYACGIGGADCETIQQGGPCYMPNTLRDHASYAFNNYYQKNPIDSSCDFGGTASVVSINPSSGSCIYPSSSSTISSSTPMVLNTNNFTSTTVFGTQPPGTTISAAPTMLNIQFRLLITATIITLLSTPSTW